MLILDIFNIFYIVKIELHFFSLVLDLFINILSGIIFIKIHCIILARDTDSNWTLNIGKKEILYFAFGIELILMSVVVAFLITKLILMLPLYWVNSLTDVYFLYLINTIPVYYIVFRLIIRFPSIAIGQDLGLVRAWQLSSCYSIWQGSFLLGFIIAITTINYFINIHETLFLYIILNSLKLLTHVIGVIFVSILFNNLNKGNSVQCNS